MTLFGTIRAPRELIFGSGQRHALGKVAVKLGKRALVVTDERLADAALPALAILLAGVAPVLLLTRSMRPAEQAAPVDARSPVESHADPR